ncbi:MAG: hypothetical protein JWP85_1885, partial [Rhodoglobus sp.]|nr:hypothetical protein [Rhodoglobus sp.]
AAHPARAADTARAAHPSAPLTPPAPPPLAAPLTPTPARVLAPSRRKRRHRRNDRCVCGGSTLWMRRAAPGGDHPRWADASPPASGSAVRRTPILDRGSARRRTRTRPTRRLRPHPTLSRRPGTGRPSPITRLRAAAAPGRSLQPHDRGGALGGARPRKVSRSCACDRCGRYQSPPRARSDRARVLVGAQR